MIADGICEVLDRTMHYEYDRHSQRKKRDKNEIGLHAVRGGTIVGEHEVLFAGHHETLLSDPCGPIKRSVCNRFY